MGFMDKTEKHRISPSLFSKDVLPSTSSSITQSHDQRAGAPVLFISLFIIHLLCFISTKEIHLTESCPWIENTVFLLTFNEASSLTFSLLRFFVVALINCTFVLFLTPVPSVLRDICMFYLCGSQGWVAAVESKGNKRSNKQWILSSRSVNCLHAGLGISETDAAGSSHVTNWLWC